MLSIIEFLRAAGAPLPSINFKTPNWAIWTKGAAGVLTDEDEAEQTIITICSTALGTDPLRPEFGCDFLPCLDLPLGRASILLTARVTAALATWESRIKVIAVRAAGNENGVLEITVSWQWKNNKAGPLRTVSFALQ